MGTQATSQDTSKYRAKPTNNKMKTQIHHRLCVDQSIVDFEKLIKSKTKKTTNFYLKTKSQKCVHEPTKMFGIPAPKTVTFSIPFTNIRIRFPYVNSPTAAYGHLNVVFVQNFH